MFGIDATEFVLLIVLAVLLFGPEHIPEMSRKAARVVVYLRGIANNAQDQLRQELGPEYADLTIADLNPKAFVKKHLKGEIAALEEAKAELNLARRQVEDATQEAKRLSGAATLPESSQPVAAPRRSGPLRFDCEAT